MWLSDCRTSSFHALNSPGELGLPMQLKVKRKFALQLQKKRSAEAASYMLHVSSETAIEFENTMRILQQQQPT